MGLIKQLIIISLIVAIVGLLSQQKSVQEATLKFVNQNIPWLVPVFNYAKYQILSGTLIGLFLYLVFANIPLLPSLPAEAYIIFSFIKGSNVFGIIGITTFVYVFFAIGYYLIGRLFGERILEKMFKKPIGYSNFLDRFIGPLIFIAYLLPIPVPIPVATALVLISGSYKTKLTIVIKAVAVATLLRFSGIIILYHFYTPIIQEYLDPLNKWLKFS